MRVIVLVVQDIGEYTISGYTWTPIVLGHSRIDTLNIFLGVSRDTVFLFLTNTQEDTGESMKLAPTAHFVSA